MGHFNVGFRAMWNSTCEWIDEHKVEVSVAFILVVTTVICFIYKSKTGGLPAERISDVTTNVVPNLADNSRKFFGGLSQNTLDGLAKDTSRGVKADVHGDTLVYTYRSASGKTTNAASFKYDDEGNIISYLGNGPYYSANSPRFFLDKIFEETQKND